MARSLALVASAPVHADAHDAHDVDAADDVARIAAFLRAIEDAVATRREPWRFGTALFDDEHPVKWDANFLRVERPVGAATPAELAADADARMAHLAHREFVVVDDLEGARLAAGFVELGYTSERLVAMALRRDRDRDPPPVATQEVSWDQVAPLLGEISRRAYPADADALVAHDRVFGERVGARYFAARVDGDLVGCCQLYERDGVAQIESVDTLEEHRGRGVARAFLDATIEAARAGGAGLIFLVADDADWPKHLYGKLGFDEVGHHRQFTKPPTAA
jgi:GNAT superfamily N-acetyltransferase